MSARVDFRFPGRRWEICPIQDPATALVLFAKNYDIRIEGKVFPAGASGPSGLSGDGDEAGGAHD